MAMKLFSSFLMLLVLLGTTLRGSVGAEIDHELLEREAKNDPQIAFLVAVSTLNSGIEALKADDLRGALETLSAAQNKFLEILGDDVADAHLAETYNNLGVVYERINNMDKALDYYVAALEHRRALLEASEGQVGEDECRVLYAVALSNVASARQRLSIDSSFADPEAVESVQKAVATLEPMPMVELLRNAIAKAIADRASAIEQHAAAAEGEETEAAEGDEPEEAQELSAVPRTHTVNIYVLGLETYFKANMWLGSRLEDVHEFDSAADKFAALLHIPIDDIEVESLAELRNEAQLQLGLVQLQKGKMDTAMRSLQDVLAKSQSPSLLADAAFHAGVIYRDLEHFKPALDAFHRALSEQQKLYGEQGHSSVAETLSNIGSIYMVAGQGQPALDAYFGAITVLDRLALTTSGMDIVEIDDKETRVPILMNIAMVYAEILQDQASASEYYEKARKVLPSGHPWIGHIDQAMQRQ